MNDFVKSLRVESFKRNDEMIKRAIIELFRNVELENDVKQNRMVIEDRCKGIEEVFEDFDTNMGIIEHGIYAANNSSRYETIIDNYLVREIKSKQNDISSHITNNIQSDKELTLEKTELQIDDRIKRITSMMRHYNENMKLLEDSKNKTDKNLKIEQKEYAN